MIYAIGAVLVALVATRLPAVDPQFILGNDGRPSLIGVFNDLQVAAIPFTLPRIAFAARILFTREEAGRNVWVYEGVSRDPVTGKTDPSASVYFADGMAVDVLFP